MQHCLEFGKKCFIIAFSPLILLILPPSVCSQIRSFFILLQIRSRFTELWVNDITDREDVRMIVAGYLKGRAESSVVEGIVDFFLEATRLSKTVLVDGTSSFSAVLALFVFLSYICSALQNSRAHNGCV